MKISNIYFIIFLSLSATLMYRWWPQKVAKDSSILVVGTSADYPPYEFKDPKTGQVVGFEMDVITEIAHRLNKTIIIKDMPFTSLIFSLITQDIDIIAAGMGSSARRAKFVKFTQNYLQGDPFVALSKAALFQPKSIDDLQGKTVVVNTGYTAESYISEYKNINIVRLKTPAQALMALQSGSVDAYVSAKSPLQAMLKELPNASEYTMLELSASGDGYAFALAKQSTLLANQINQVIEIMIQDGTIDRIKEKWGI